MDYTESYEGQNNTFWNTALEMSVKHISWANKVRNDEISKKIVIVEYVLDGLDT